MHATRRLAVVVTVAALGVSGQAAAQDGQGYVGGAVMLSTQGAHRQGSGPSLPTTGAGGHAIGGTVEAGWLAVPRVALGVELSLPRRYTSVQETDYLRVFQQESRHRDLAISGVLRVTAVSAGGVRVGLVGGAGMVQESTRQRRRDQESPLPMYPPVFGPYSDEYTFTRWTPAALAGADVEVVLTRRVAVVGQLRAHFVRRSSDPSEPGWALGLDRVVLRPAIGLRATF